MMKPVVLQLVDSFDDGGSERQALQLARLLRTTGRYEVRIASLRADGPLRGLLDEGEFDPGSCYPLQSFYDRNTVRQLTRFVRRLRELKVDVIHTHDYYTNIFGMSAASIAGIPVKIASRRESSKKGRARRFVERQAYRAADRIVSNCDEVRRQLIAEGVNGAKVLTLYNGLDLNRVDHAISRSPGEPFEQFGQPRDSEGRVVTIIANLREVKDHQTFLRAARRVFQEEPRSAFILAGEGHLRQSLRALARGLGLERRVVFLGRCEKIADLLQVSDVCVLSSVSEGFPNSILEYMAAGRPVVATDVGGVREALGDGDAGYMVRAGDDRAMAQSILSLLLDQQTARRMGNRGRALVEERFSAEIQLQRVEQLYDYLLAKNKRAARLNASGATTNKVRVNEQSNYNESERAGPRGRVIADDQQAAEGSDNRAIARHPGRTGSSGTTLTELSGS